MSEQSQIYLGNFKNLLDKGTSLMMRSYDPVVPVIKTRRSTPDQVKLRVMASQRLNKYIDDTTNNKNERQKKVFEALQMLSEIGFDQNIFVLRSLGTIIGNLMNKLYTKVLINETSINNLKASLGHQQVIYLPSHRSYADFMLMSFVCFSYNLEVPAIAAGMDFHSMMGLGELLRKTGAFFMRRTFGGDEFYWRVFKEYMHEIITYHDRGLEFFVEGTRSRSYKALTPKIGLLSMALEPFFMGEIHDIKIVPISVSYEKPLEEQLFVYELLGIPKPKETTMGFLKAITNLKNQNLGKIYFDVCEPISLNEYFGAKADRFKHATDPAFVQTLGRDEVHLVTHLANDVVKRQQRNMVIVTYNLMALIYNEAVFTSTVKNLTMFRMKEKIHQLTKLFEALGAIVAVDINDLNKDITETMIVHQNILGAAGSNMNIQLTKSNVDLNNINASKLKGIRLNNETMNIAVPAFSLQLYCNPTLFWLAQPAFVVLSLIGTDEVEISKVKKEFETLRRIFIYEFVLYPEFLDVDFEQTIAQLLSIGIVKKTSPGTLQLSKESTFTNVLLSAIAPFINSFLHTSNVILRCLKDKDFTEKDVFTSVQTEAEKEILGGSAAIHPYSLCLESINLVILSLCNSGCLFKQKQNAINHYTINIDNLTSLVTTMMHFNTKLPFEYKYFDIIKSSKL